MSLVSLLEVLCESWNLIVSLQIHCAEVQRKHGSVLLDCGVCVEVEKEVCPGNFSER